MRSNFGFVHEHPAKWLSRGQGDEGSVWSSSPHAWIHTVTKGGGPLPHCHIKGGADQQSDRTVRQKAWRTYWKRILPTVRHLPYVSWIRADWNSLELSVDPDNNFSRTFSFTFWWCLMVWLVWNYCMGNPFGVISWPKNIFDRRIANRYDQRLYLNSRRQDWAESYCSWDLHVCVIFGLLTWKDGSHWLVLKFGIIQNETAQSYPKKMHHLYEFVWNEHDFRRIGSEGHVVSPRLLTLWPERFQAA